ncbi:MULTISPECIES: hemolysin family protein [Rhodomicrobium]|uniref:hemolysin family protein n=1 Tax=Rhodomicrobium TaxID=1068 RepID=UPI0014823DE4|nr:MULTISPECIES: hemolysin family protein [Rhodomicrobium]
MAMSNSYGNPNNGERQDNGLSWFDRLAANLGFSNNVDTRTVIEEALADDDGASFTAAERAMLQKTLRFRELRVEDVMVPRAEIVAVDADAPLSELLAVFADGGHSRVPVYRDTLDEPLGMVHVKDLMNWIIAQASAAAPGNNFDLGAADLSKTIAEADIKRDLIFAPPSMSALDLLVRMQAKHVHLALIIDEHGGTDGLVSIEDLLEEVVGNIEDEHDADHVPLIAQEGGELIADARAEIEEVEQKMGVLLTSENDDEVDTLGGLIFTMLGRVPVRGEVVQHPSGLEFEVLDADRRRVKKFKVRPTPGSPGNGADGSQFQAA